MYDICFLREQGSIYCVDLNSTFKIPLTNFPCPFAQLHKQVWEMPYSYMRFPFTNLTLAQKFCVQTGCSICPQLFFRSFCICFAEYFIKCDVKKQTGKKKKNLKNVKHDGHISSQHNALVCAMKYKFNHGDVVVPTTDIASMFSKSIKILWNPDIFKEAFNILAAIHCRQHL